MLDNLTKKYTEYILNPNPSKTWKVVRFFIHWLTLPLKLVAIGGLGITQIVLKLFVKNRTVPQLPSLETKRAYFKKIMDNMPVFKGNYIELYTNRVPYYSIPNGANHNPDHQCSRHSTYSFLMDRIGKRNLEQDAATAMHMTGPWLARGYTWNPYEDRIQYNVNTVSGDMLCGLNLAMLNNKNEALEIKYEEMLAHLIDNDYSLLEGGSPEAGDPGYEMYQAELKHKYPEEIRMKSARGMWQPGLETAGAQALTLLSALRIGDKKLKMPSAKKAYRKMLWQYGYGLLSLFPTAYIDSKRGYFNDHNCLIALYVLSKCADNALSKLFWKIPMVYVWLLSRHWYNAYFTGLLQDAHPGTVSQKYVDKCIAYLYENEPRVYGHTDAMRQTTSEVPVTFNEILEDEFSPDQQMDRHISYSDENSKVKTGLGFMAHAVMIEKDPKSLLEDK